jgi:hypothetical protein
VFFFKNADKIFEKTIKNGKISLKEKALTDAIIK